MILRKPYAFLIKYFTLIHFALMGLMIYIVVRFHSALTFLNNYIDNIASISEAETYINLGLYVAIFLVIGITFVIFWLMKTKNKPKLFYIFNMSLYVILFIMATVLATNFGLMDETVLNTKTVRMLRDFLLVSNFVQYIFIAVMLARSLGFDVKKFDFTSDVNEMAIESSDNEEFEFNVGVDFQKIERGTRGYLRELKYYYEENKTVILAILGILVFILGIYIISNITINKVYKEDDLIKSNIFEMTVTDSYTSKLSYNGDSIEIKDQTYLIVKMDIRSLYEGDYELEINDFSLKIKDKIYFPTKKYYQYFTDVGYGYDKQQLEFKEPKTYILVFLVDNKLLNKKKILNYHEGYYYEKKDYISSDKRVKLEPSDLDTKKELGTTNLNEKMYYTSNVIGGGDITIKDYEFDNQYDLDNNKIIMAGYNKTVLRLGVESNLGKYTNNKFFTNFVSLYYVVNGELKESQFKNKTPKNSLDQVYLEVSDEIEEATNIYLEIKIRNNVYKYVIK